MKQFLLTKPSEFRINHTVIISDLFIVNMLQSLIPETLQLIIEKMFHGDLSAINIFCQTPFIFGLLFVCERIKLTGGAGNLIPINISIFIPKTNYDLLQNINKTMYSEKDYEYLNILPLKIRNALDIDTDKIKIKLSFLSRFKIFLIGTIQIFGFLVIIYLIYFYDNHLNYYERIMFFTMLLFLSCTSIWITLNTMQPKLVCEYYETKLFHDT